MSDNVSSRALDACPGTLVGPWSRDLMGLGVGRAMLHFGAWGMGRGGILYGGREKGAWVGWRLPRSWWWEGFSGQMAR